MLKENTIDFLLYSYFGVSLNDLSQKKECEIIEICAQKAYGDLCRTLEFANSTTNVKGKEKADIEVDHRKFCNAMCGRIREEIEKLLDDPAGKASPNGFDLWHKGVCQVIVKQADQSNALADNPDGEGKIFYCGQAQKWLNMTLKYMWLLGLWEDQFEALLPVLHVPVDRYIIQAVWEEDEEIEVPMPVLISTKDAENDEESIKEIIRKKRRAGRGDKRADEKVLSWSRWTEREYKPFQAALREWCKSRAKVFKTPLEWESSAWIRVAREKSLQ